MAKKEQELTASMIDTFREFKETKNIDRTTLVSVLEESFRNVLAKIFGSDENFDVIVNPDKGDFEIYRNRIVVADGEVEDENKEITLSEARKIEPDYEVGEDVSETVDFNKFGRRAILTLRQTLASKILELEHDSLYNKYKDRVGQVISGEVYQVWKREVLIVDDENNELMLPKTEQIPGDTYRKGETVRAVILRVDNENNNPKIILSRTAPIFLQRLLEAEVPEIADGLIAIRRIARLPGERAKIAVETFTVSFANFATRISMSSTTQAIPNSSFSVRWLQPRFLQSMLMMRTRKQRFTCSLRKLVWLSAVAV